VPHTSIYVRWIMHMGPRFLPPTFFPYGNLVTAGFVKFGNSFSPNAILAIDSCGPSPARPARSDAPELICENRLAEDVDPSRLIGCINVACGIVVGAYAPYEEAIAG
jgi:hypothetical protein